LEQPNSCSRNGKVISNILTPKKEKYLEILAVNLPLHAFV
jgi:hypothetical protein